MRYIGTPVSSNHPSFPLVPPRSPETPKECFSGFSEDSQPSAPSWPERCRADTSILSFFNVAEDSGQHKSQAQGRLKVPPKPGSAPVAEISLSFCPMGHAPPRAHTKLPSLRASPKPFFLHGGRGQEPEGETCAWLHCRWHSPRAFPHQLLLRLEN